MESEWDRQQDQFSGQSSEAECPYTFNALVPYTVQPWNIGTVAKRGTRAGKSCKQCLASLTAIPQLSAASSLWYSQQEVIGGDHFVHRSPLCRTNNSGCCRHEGDHPLPLLTHWRIPLSLKLSCSPVHYVQYPLHPPAPLHSPLLDAKSPCCKLDSWMHNQLV